MKISQIITEGGWVSSVTQQTKITPSVVKSVLPIASKFVDGFNKWLQQKNIHPMKTGAPLGSSAYYQKDDEATEYGDIDLQAIAPDMSDKTESQIAGYYNKLMDEYIEQRRPDMIHYEGTPAQGQPIFKIGEQYVQVDFVWSAEKFADWSRYRKTPAHGVKGAVHGSMFASFGEIMHFSIQGAGVQIKIRDGQTQPFAKTRRYDNIETVSVDIQTFGVDIVKWMHQKIDKDSPLQLAPRLKSNPGLAVDDVKTEQLAEVIKGVADTFELNDMYGYLNLREYSSREDFIDAFLENYANKMKKAASASKFDKAETDEARTKANETKKKLLNGIKLVTKLMNN